MNKQFQYQRIAYPATGTEALEKALNVQGDDGWEAIFFERTQQGLSIIFMKETQGTYTIPEEERMPKQYLVELSMPNVHGASRFFSGWQSSMQIITTDDPRVPEPVSLEQAQTIIEKLQAIGIATYEMEVF